MSAKHSVPGMARVAQCSRCGGWTTRGDCQCPPAPITRAEFLNIRQSGDPDQAYAECCRILSDPDLEPYEALSECSERIDGFGVESMTLADGGELLYVNKGDTYDSTLCHTDAEGYFVSSWGDVYEASDREHEEETGERRCCYCSEWSEQGEPCGSCGRDPETGDPWPLRDVRLETGHTLRTWDTGRTDSMGRTWIGYVPADPDGAPIFRCTDFRCSPMDPIDSDESLRALLGFLTLRPGDTDPEYFEDYTDRPRAFCESYACEYLSFLYSEEGPGTFADAAEGEA